MGSDKLFAAYSILNFLVRLHIIRAPSDRYDNIPDYLDRVSSRYKKPSKRKNGKA